MTDGLRTVALLGTSQQTYSPDSTGTEMDRILSSLQTGNGEQNLLLIAGALAVWHRAGFRPGLAPDPERAPLDTLLACSEGIERVLQRMLAQTSGHNVLYTNLGLSTPHVRQGLAGDHVDLLPEALALIRSRGLRLRYSLLPDVLGAHATSLRAALRPVMGERGHWLAGINSVWVWAASLPPRYADWLWESGTPQFRADLLRVHRRVDSAAARTRLEGTFFSERADAQLLFLEALQPELSPADEPFLERVLNSRAPRVRLVAAQMLCTLPGSACAQRVRDRADTMLRWKSGRIRDAVEVAVPSTFDRSWRREGLEPNSTAQGIDAPGLWLVQTVGLVPVQHWLDRFGVSLPALLGASRGRRDRQVLEAWTRAAVLHEERNLFPLLWDAWWKRREEARRHAQLFADMWAELARHMDSSALDQRLARMLATPPEPEQTCARVLDAIPWPWPGAAGDAFMQALRVALERFSAGTSPPDYMLHALLPAARGIPSEYVRPALDLLRDIESADRSLELWQRVLEVAAEKLGIRQRLREEMGL